MRIGLSLRKCVLDIFEDKVDYNDVLVLITRTDFDPGIDEQWSEIWEAYTRYSLTSAHVWPHQKEKEFRDLVTKLYTDGKIHQPRQFGVHPTSSGDRWHWLETLAPTEDVEKNPAVKKAWDNYKILAGLS